MSPKTPPSLNVLAIPSFSYHQPATYAGGSAPVAPGFTPSYSGSGSGSAGQSSYLGDFDGSGNPNTEFNFNIGQLWDGSVTGHGGNKGGQGPTNSPGPANGPQNYEFGQWTWEQILNEVLNLNIPDRNVIGANNPNVRWTTVESNSSGDSGRIYIYGVTWGPDHQDTLTYLSTWLQTPGNPWDSFLNEPYQALYESETGNLASYTTALDPASFAGPIYALQGVEGFYANAATSLNAFANDLSGDQSAFQGQAAGAFAQLIWDLWDQANQISTQMGTPGVAGSYDQQLLDSMQAAETFLNSIWNAYADWTNVMEHSPLGAILRALIVKNVVVGTPGQWTTNPNMPPSETPFGDLSTDAAWQSVEAAAKQLWLDQIGSKLDGTARSALLNLAGSYYATQTALQAISTIPPPQVTPANPNVSLGGGGAGGPNINMPPISVAPPNVDIPPFPNIPGFGNGNIPDFPRAFASMNPMGPNTNVPGGIDPGLSNAFKNLADLGQANLNLAAAGINAGNDGLSKLANLDNSAFGGLANLQNSGLSQLASLDNSGFGGLINGVSGIRDTGLASLGNTPLLNTLTDSALPTLGGNQTVSDLGNALANSDQTQNALRQALATGMVPTSGPLAKDLAQALGSNGQVQSILGGALSGGTPSISGLQTALADNADTQAALKKALALAPSSGPLHNALERALSHSRATQSAIKHTLAGIAPPGESINQVLGTDGSLQSALHRAMASGQIPSSGVLHDSMQAAMAESGKLKNALDQLAAGGAVPSHAALHRAMSDNLVLQKELNRALASGQVPRTGPLHADLERALAQSVKLGGELHQSLAGLGIVAEPGIGVQLGNQALTGAVGGLGQPLIAPGGGLAAPSGVPLPGGGGVGVVGPGPAGGVQIPGGGAVAAAGLGSGGLASAGPSLSSGRFLPPETAAAAGAGASELPLYPPMAGMGMGMGMGQNGMGQERERTTWLSEDEDVWGAQPEGRPPQVIGREVDDDLADYDLDELPERGPSDRDRRGGYQRGHLR